MMEPMAEDLPEVRFDSSIKFSASKSFYYWQAVRGVDVTCLPGIMQVIRILDDDDIHRISTLVIPPDRLPTDYLQSLLCEDLVLCLRACLLVYTITRAKFIPRDFQLEASLETVRGRDSVIIAGTGSGKTLCILIPLLLDPVSISITISPLKRLQMMQVCLYSASKLSQIYSVQVKDFVACGIRTLAINEDTPHSAEIWKVCEINTQTGIN